MELSEIQKQELRLWCMTHNCRRMYEIYQWLNNSNSIEELELKKEYTYLAIVIFKQVHFKNSTIG